MKSIITTVLLALAASSALAQTSAVKPAPAQPALAAPPYTIEDTAVHVIAARELKRQYDIYVSLPVGYKQSTRRYPVLFVADAPYAFPVLRSLSRRVGDSGRGLEDFILVGIGYSQGDSATFSRRRDYTPVPPTETGLAPDESGRAPQFGQAPQFAKFIASDVFPLIAQRYRADMTRKVFLGHSYGSLLGLHILFSSPDMFDQYILGSPSLWYANGQPFEQEKAYFQDHKDLKARVYFAVGGDEVPSATHPDRHDMVGDLKRLENLLKSRHYPSLRIKSHVFEGEDHLSVAPAIATHGLRWLLPGTDK